MEAVPVLHCLLHDGCLQPPTEAADKACLAKPCLPLVPSSVEASCGSSAGAMSASETPVESTLGESLLDLPQRFRSPPRAAEAPDSYLFRRLTEGKLNRVMFKFCSPPLCNFTGLYIFLCG